MTGDFTVWYEGLSQEEQESVELRVDQLEQAGIALPHPLSSAIKGSPFAMRELRIQHAGQPYRVFYAFDPKRQAVLLIGGNKGGNDRFYAEMIPRAERIWQEYLRETGE